MSTVDPVEIMQSLYEADTEKTFDDPSDVAIFDPPLVGVADALDPWFLRFKNEILGDYYWTPHQALSIAAPGAVARSVVCFVLPLARIARTTNRSQTEMPSRHWAYGRTFGEAFVTRMRRGLEQRLREMGYAAVAPAVMPEHKVESRPRVGLSANWSERHTAFVAGLGTFGLSGGLITERGIAHRLGSVVTDAAIEPTPRPYGDDPFAWCLKVAEGTCGRCVERCPAKAIGEKLHERNKDACRQWAYEKISRLGPEAYGWQGVYGCGLCQTAVPCEARNPVRKK